jgi:hypothetical protein
MDDMKAMTRAGETVGKAVSSGWLTARRNAKRAGQASVDATSRAAHTADRKLTERGVAPRQIAEALAEGAEVARKEVAKTTRRARRKLAKKAKATRKDLAKAAKQARKDAAKSKAAKRTRADVKKLKATVKAETAALKARAREEAAALKLADTPKRKRRWPKVMLLAIVVSGIAYVVRSKAAQEAVPEPRSEEPATPRPDAEVTQNGQQQKSSTKS